MTSPSWPVELATFNPETEYLHTPGYPAYRGKQAWHLARARAAKGCGFDEAVVLAEIMLGTPSVTRGYPLP